MSNYLAIATVTKTLQHLLQDVVKDVDGADVTTRRPDRMTDGLDKAQVNLFLYQVTPNGTWRNTDLPTRSANGTLIQRPLIGLDLSYLLSFYGSDDAMVPQRLLGCVVSALHARPLLRTQDIEETVQENAYLAQSDLASPVIKVEQMQYVKVQHVKVAMQPLNLEELSKLWSVFFQTPYVLSVAYQASVVLLEASDDPQPIKQVREKDGVHVQVDPHLPQTSTIPGEKDGDPASQPSGPPTGETT